MPHSAPLFDGADVTGITWGPATSSDGQPTDLAQLRQWAAEFEEAGVPEDAPFDPIGLLRAAADEIDALRAEVIALKKGAATLTRKCAALQRIADGGGLDVTVREKAS
jgi:hypothetical protein